MKQIKNILVPYDGSNCSKHAFKLALDVAEKYDAKLILITCIEKLNGSWFGHEHLPFYQKEVTKYKEKIKKEITKLEFESKNRKIPLTTKFFVTDSIVKQILSFSKSRRIHLIVMGSHGKTGLDKLILGSVANGIVQKSKIPVLIVR